MAWGLTHVVEDALPDSTRSRRRVVENRVLWEGQESHLSDQGLRGHFLC